TKLLKNVAFDLALGLVSSGMRIIRFPVSKSTFNFNFFELIETDFNFVLSFTLKVGNLIKTLSRCLAALRGRIIEI
ncbi:hypothetical protein, partial [Marinifaba aquimaris]|uniref:hypothetical protein n=1 Tax=Marinifaba aquimaris TaxID=2741323 RepID=UPI001C2D842A